VSLPVYAILPLMILKRYIYNIHIIDLPSPVSNRLINGVLPQVEIDAHDMRPTEKRIPQSLRRSALEATLPSDLLEDRRRTEPA
jgi:hypothetical protein